MRSTTVVGVDVSVGAVTGVAVTLIDSFAPAMLRAKCSTGCEPETTITSFWICSNPTAATVTTYSPSGTALSVKLPFASEFTVAFHSEFLALIITIASDTGRCCGSWITPRTVPTTAATASRVRDKNTVKSSVRAERMQTSNCKEPGAEAPRISSPNAAPKRRSSKEARAECNNLAELLSQGISHAEKHATTIGAPTRIDSYSGGGKMRRSAAGAR